MSSAAFAGDLGGEPDGRGGLSLHATTVADDGRALVIAGPSGSGKSGIAAQMIALGARLVADDLTVLRLEDGALIASAPMAAGGRMELRGLGLCSVPAVPRAAVAAVLTLAPSPARMPAEMSALLLDRAVPLLRHPVDAALAAKALLWLRACET
jgi:HPr kinase/phosphorylase